MVTSETRSPSSKETMLCSPVKNGVLVSQKSSWQSPGTSPCVHINRHSLSAPSALEDAAVKVRHVLTLTEAHLPYHGVCVRAWQGILMSELVSLSSLQPYRNCLHVESTMSKPTGQMFWQQLQKMAFHWFYTHELCSEAGTPGAPPGCTVPSVLGGSGWISVAIRRKHSTWAEWASQVHTDSAVRRECPFLCCSTFVQ